MSKFYSLKVADIQRATRDAVVITFAVPPDAVESFRFTQGQHLTLRADIDGQDVRRSYSICSAVQDGSLRVAVKRVTGGAFSNWINDTLRSGQSIDVMPPSGHFYVPLVPTQSKHYLAFASGSGITPVFSIVKTTLLTEPNSRFTLIYGNRASSSVLLRDELAELKDQFLERLQIVYFMSREHQDIELFNGRIDRQHCDALFKNWIRLDSIDAVFVCGPTGMMDDVQASLDANGFPKSKIKVEMFAAGAPTAKRVVHTRLIEGHEDCEVTVQMDGVRRQFTVQKGKEPVLDAALRQGIELPYSCKGGVCSTCRCKLVEGEVDMDTNFALEDYEVARGYILSCQSYPITDKLVIDFDQPG